MGKLIGGVEQLKDLFGDRVVDHLVGRHFVRGDNLLDVADGEDFQTNSFHKGEPQILLEFVPYKF